MIPDYEAGLVHLLFLSDNNAVVLEEAFVAAAIFEVGPSPWYCAESHAHASVVSIFS